ncbi:MAG: hypothetical protein NZ898_09460 [Myxococcota bacterium]|nr:hypothetical protein [Myxococcota bacterium]MDW8362785.1 hypothetical protein [Myxococcales bacterium]
MNLRRGAATALLALGVSVAFWWPAFRRPEASGWGDWQWFHHLWEAGRVALVRWGEAPLWNPHHCGGVSLWGNPQWQLASPTYWFFGLPFGTNVGHKLFVLWHTVVGWLGTYALARREFHTSRAAALFAATAFCTSGFFAWHGAGGHATFLAFYYGPLLLLCWRRAARDLRWSAAVAGLLALMLLEGGHYPFPYWVVWLALDALVRLADRRARVGVLRAAVVSSLLTALLGAIRIVPIALALRDHPRPTHDTDALRFAEIVEMLTAREHAYVWPGHRWVWPEYGAYVGWMPLVAGAAGALVAAARLLRPSVGGPARTGLAFLLVGGLLALGLTQGRASPLHPWPLLHELPFYGSLHVPSRWRVMLLLHLVLLAALALDATHRLLAGSGSRRRRRLRRWTASLTWAAALVTCVDIYLVTRPIVDRWNGPPVGVGPVAPRHHLVEAVRYLDEYANYPHRNVGTPTCYDPLPWPVAPGLWLGDVPQARLSPPDAGRVEDWGRTSLTVWARARLERPATVVFNQNHARGWHSEQGRVVADEGRLAVVVPHGGSMRVEARYRPEELPYTVGLFALGIAGCLVVARRRPRR